MADAPSAVSAVRLRCWWAGDQNAPDHNSFAGGALALSLFGVAAAGTLEDDTAHLIAE
jgi:hypothetical protein